jgi:hypothetical protein
MVFIPDVVVCGCMSVVDVVGRSVLAIGESVVDIGMTVC